MLSVYMFCICVVPLGPIPYLEGMKVDYKRQLVSPIGFYGSVDTPTCSELQTLVRGVGRVDH